MQFEKPIAEIQKFALKDIISASSNLHKIDAESYADDGLCHGNAWDDGNPMDTYCL